MKTYKYTASICSVYKNETLHILEWIEYHRLIGFQHFYLYNNLSNDDLPVTYKDDRKSDKIFREALIEYYTNIGILTHHEYTVNLSEDNFKHQINLPDYPFNHCTRFAKGESKWVAYIDMDEFIFINNKNKNIIDILNDKFSHADGISLNAHLFGTSKHYFESKGLCIDNYKYENSKMDHFVKLMYKPDHIIQFNGPHVVHPVERTVSVDGAGKIIRPHFSIYGIVNPILTIYHYRSKSLWYWLNVKLGRVFNKKTILDMERPGDGMKKSLILFEILFEHIIRKIHTIIGINITVISITPYITIQ
jgi:hypothetical protein